MRTRPILSSRLDSETFKAYYYLKEELVLFCKEVGLQSTGGKESLTERIYCFLDTGKKLRVTNNKKVTVDIGKITLDSIIEENFVCSEKHRAFFKEVIGSRFLFNVIFQKWLKSNTGKTYSRAVDAYYNIQEEKKVVATKIDSQFEYNTYIRDFFNDNKGKLLSDAIKCWKYKKGLQGHNRYETKDLLVLDLDIIK
ncbi:DUF6434 domain-containing protein [Clostridium gasigenes]|uniref:DUF6434 domain-containing protein n=1 Tax=Clostridium gasigenes TaxID=94869 RepID=A0A7X0SEF7_9CLOT|nr:DUF6434 domain-containing protein [Clostridium gasigenes]MBB6716082.1 hypothetical protein [Clostridium gasigenes]